MSLLRFWNYLSFGALILSGLTFSLLLLSGYSYWLMRFFFAVAGSVTPPLILISLIFMGVTALSFLVKRPYWKAANTWRIILWVSVFVFSSFSFLGTFLTDYEVAANASFNDRRYYLIRFNNIDSYSYTLYSCEQLSLFCSRSSRYIGIPYQSSPISLKYDLKTRRVYIQNLDQVIQVPL
jgi:hypothetical protein